MAVFASLQVGTGMASQVILLRSDGDTVSADTQQAASLAALKAVGGGGRQKLVLQSAGVSLDRCGARGAGAEDEAARSLLLHHGCNSQLGMP